MTEKSIIIIGAGITGMAAGCYGQMNGYQTQIFEMHTLPGGVCTAWNRKGYTIDGCLHWLVGSSPNAPFYNYWQELGMIQHKKIFNPEVLYQVEGADGKVFHCYANIDRLEKHMKELAPEDTASIEELAGAIRHFIGFDMPVEKPSELYNALDGLKILVRMRKYLGLYRKWSKTSMRDLAARFKNPLLRVAFQEVWPPDFAAAVFLITLAELDQKTAGYPLGGSMGMTLSLEERYVKLGGKVNYKSRVEKILVQSDRAVGIRLSDGREFKADYVISAADGHSTIFDMLDGKYLDDTIRGYYANNLLYNPLVYLGLGVNRSFKDVPQIISGIALNLDKPIEIGNKELKILPVRIHNFDASLAPEGKTVLTISIESEFTYWEELRKDPARYKAEKERIAVAVISALNLRFPGIINQIEMWDVATPATFYRYTGNWKGSYEGWLPTPATMNLQMKKVLPGLSNFFMAGQWVQPGGGLPAAVMTGSHIIQILCRQDKKKYLVSLP
jgi:phytoene dehydrogenase-like protein